MRGGFRYYREDMDNDYIAFNPLNGLFGYPALDGSLAAGGLSTITADPVNGNRIHYRSIPFGQQKFDLDLDADYRLAHKTTLSLGYQMQGLDFENREIDQSLENRMKLGLTNRDLNRATVRLSYEFAERDGDDYSFFPYADFYTNPFSAPHTLSSLRKYDVGDRTQHVLKLQANYLLRDDMDIFVSGHFEDNSYNASHGRTGENKKGVNLQWSYVPAPLTTLYAFYGFQQAKTEMSGINDVFPPAANDPNPGGQVFPFANQWAELDNETDHLVGVGATRKIWKLIADVNYSFIIGEGNVNYSFASTGSLTAPTVVPGTEFPELKFTRHILETSLTWPLHKNLSLRFLHHFEHSQTEDWHYQGLTPVIGQYLYLDATPTNYDVNVFAVLVQARF